MRSFIRPLSFCVLFVALGLVTTGIARAQTLSVTNGWVRLLPGNLPQGGYFTLHNGGDKTVTLVGAAAPGYGKVMLHKTVHQSGVDKMVHVESIDVKPGDNLVFAPGGYHIMLMQPHNHLEPGDKLPVTLLFGDGDKLTADFDVRSATGE
jgi:copper(I)-binding protein